MYLSIKFVCFQNQPVVLCWKIFYPPGSPKQSVRGPVLENILTPGLGSAHPPAPCMACRWNAIRLNHRGTLNCRSGLPPGRNMYPKKLVQSGRHVRRGSGLQGNSHSPLITFWAPGPSRARGANIGNNANGNVQREARCVRSGRAGTSARARATLEYM